MSFFRDQLQISTDPYPASLNPTDILAYKSGSQQSFLSRLQMLQSNLTRVTNQHQALLHLLDLVQLLPHIQKNLEQSQQAKHRLQQLSHKMQQFHSTLKQNINHGAYSSMDSNFKSLNAQVQELKQRLKETESEHVVSSKGTTGRMKEEAAQIIRGVDLKIHNSKGDIDKFVKEMRKGVRGEEGEGVGAASRAMGLFVEERQYYDNQLHNIKREIGLLQCEMEYLMDLERTAKIRNSIKMLGNLTANEKNFSIGYLQQQLFLQQFEGFEESNSNRIKYELQLISTGLQKLPTCVGNVRDKPTLSKLKNELHYLQDRQFSVVSQLKGSDTKKALQLKRLDNRMSKIDQLGSELSISERKTLETKLQEIQLLKSKLKHNRKMIEGNRSVLEGQLDEIGKKAAMIRRMIGSA